MKIQRLQNAARRRQEGGVVTGGFWLAPQMSLGERMAVFDSQFVGWSGYKEALWRIFFLFCFGMTGRLQLTAAVKKNEIGVARVRVRDVERHNHTGCV